VEDPIDFKSVVNSNLKKKGAQSLSGFGEKRVKKLAEVNITSGQQLVDLYDGNDPTGTLARLKSKMTGFPNQKDEALKKWVSTVKEEFARRPEELRNVEESIQQVEEALATVELQNVDKRIQQVEQRLANITATTTAGQSTQVEERTPATALPTFSKLLDRGGYNVRFLSCHLIDDILQSHFQWRKPLMVRKVLGRTGKIWSMDANYKTGPRIVVYKKGLGYYRPYIGYITILGRFSQVLYWKVMTGSESITAIEDDLKRLKE
jgi:hypothetical protein